MVSRGTRLNLAKISKKLLLQQGFAAIVLTLGSTLFMFVVRGKFVNLITINIFNGMSWYVGYYFGIIVLASVFLNEFLSELDRNQYIKFLLVIFAVTQFSWIGGVLNSLAGGLLTYSIGIFLYALGGYIQRYNPYKKIKSITIIRIILAVYIVIYISEYNLIENKIQMYQGGPFFQEIIGFNTNYLVPIVIGILLFELFIRIPIFFNGVANFIGASTLMIYLLHDNSFFYSIWNTQDWIKILYYHQFLYILKHIFLTEGNFLSGVLVYWIYTIIEKKIISVTDHRSETTGGDENGQI